MAASNESVRVMVRFRPENRRERELAASSEPWKSLQSAPESRIKLNDTELKLFNIEQHGDRITYKKKEHKFYFDGLMPENTTQMEAFESVAQQTCDEILQGYNGTIFVYGQSGSGKTHTMYGPEDKKDSEDIQEMGVIPQSCAYIFEILDNKDHPLVEGMLSYEVQCEFIEIYNEMLKDLLNLNNNPKIKQICVNAHRDEWKVIVENVQRRRVSNLSEVLTAIRYASQNRTVAGTNLNATSSRSHMVMRLFVKITTADGVRTGIGNFSDLAGSEKVKKTGAKGQRLEEAKNILLSLSTLARVIEALTKNKLPPYADSKLTFMLKDSLGGNCKTTLLIAASPHVFNRDETVRSLRFGETCRKIQNKARINAVKTKAQLIKENEALKQQIAELMAAQKAGGLVPRQKSEDNEFVVIDDMKAMEKEKKKYEERIEELEKLNQRYSDQIKQITEQKEEYDEDLTKINNDFEELKFKYNELQRDMQEKQQQTEALNEKMSSFEELTENAKQLNQENKQLKMEKQRLQQTSEEQVGEINKLKLQFDKTKQEQQDLQNKWKTELDSKKSQFSKQEMQLSQNIESLELQIEQNRQSQEAMKHELDESQNKVKQVTNELHQREDAVVRLENAVNEEKERNVAVSGENEKLKIQIKELLSQIQHEKFKNANGELQLNKQKDEYEQQMQEQESKFNELETKFEVQSNELKLKNNRIAQMEKEHKQEIENYKIQMQAVADLNKQLQEENKTASEVVDDQKDTITKHKRQITDMTQEKSIIARQLQQLQTHYSKVVQRQIEEDEKIARKLAQEERRKYFDAVAQGAKGVQSKKRKRESGGDGDGDEDEEDELLPGTGVTAGGPMNEYEKDMLNLPFSDDEQEQLQRQQQQEREFADKNKKKRKEPQDEEKKEEESEEDSDDEEEYDMEAQQDLMYRKVIHQRKISGIKKKQQEELTKQRLLEYQRKQQELATLQQQLSKDQALAHQIYKNQLDLHARSWNKYGVPQLTEIEKERQQKLQEKEEQRQRHIREHYVSADQIMEQSGMDAMANDSFGDMQAITSTKKGKEKKKKKKAAANNNNEDDGNRYFDPDDGMGQIVIMDGDEDDEY